MLPGQRTVTGQPLNSGHLKIRRMMDPSDQVVVNSLVFDGRFDSARDLIRRQEHHRQGPPAVGVRNWQTSALLQPGPDSAVAQRLNDLMLEALEYAGSSHWRTGRIGTSHLTVRSIGVRQEGVRPDDLAVQRYASALRRAVSDLGELTFTVQGLAVTPGSVMAAALPADDQADQLLIRFAEELGSDADGRLELRDIWYLNLLHFTDEIADPEGLVRWVDARRAVFIGSVTIGACDLVRWDAEKVADRYEMRPSVLVRCPFGGSPGRAG